MMKGSKTKQVPFRTVTIKLTKTGFDVMRKVNSDLSKLDVGIHDKKLSQQFDSDHYTRFAFMLVARANAAMKTNPKMTVAQLLSSMTVTEVTMQ